MPETAVSRRRMAAFVILAFATTSCDQVGSTEPAINQHQHLVAAAAASPIGGSGGALLKEVHAVSARFNSTKQAEAAGYEADPFCVESPAGGMGHHWVNEGVVDPVFNATQPFNVGGTPVPVAHWSLHVWLGKPNPSGLFAPFNPDVDCP